MLIARGEMESWILRYAAHAVFPPHTGGVRRESAEQQVLQAARVRTFTVPPPFCPQATSSYSQAPCRAAPRPALVG